MIQCDFNCASTPNGTLYHVLTKETSGSECVFPLVIASEGCTPTEKWKYTRKHQVMLTVLDIPNMIMNAASHPDEDDCCRTLLEAACLVRLANALLIDESIPFIFTAIYVDNQLLASRYLVFQPDISKREVRVYTV